MWKRNKRKSMDGMRNVGETNTFPSWRVLICTEQVRGKEKTFKRGSQIRLRPLLGGDLPSCLEGVRFFVCQIKLWALNKLQHWSTISNLCCGATEPRKLNHSPDNMKRQKDMTLKDELPRSVGAQYATAEEQRNNSRENEEIESKRNNTQL